MDVNNLGNLERKVYYKISEIVAEFELENENYVNNSLKHQINMKDN